jgi:hypothetical protein
MTIQIISYREVPIGISHKNILVSLEDDVSGERRQAEIVLVPIDTVLAELKLLYTKEELWAVGTIISREDSEADRLREKIGDYITIIRTGDLAQLRVVLEIMARVL